jgi:hypothetical protein
MKADRHGRIIRAMKRASRLWMDGIISTDTFDKRWSALYASAFGLNPHEQ